MLKIANKCYDPALIIFDKDGTLIEFDLLWHAWFSRLLAALASRVALQPEVLAAVAATLGYDPQTDMWDPEGPLTLATIAEIRLLLAGLLYRYQKSTWNQAVEIVDSAEANVRSTLPLAELVRPVGDARKLLLRLRAAGIRLAVATSDVRQITEPSLQAAHLDDLIEVVICADDAHAVKPLPDAVLAICTQMGIPTARTIVVGDSVDDLLMARAAGAMAGIGVASGASPAESLEPYADAVIRDIHDIRICS